MKYFLLIAINIGCVQFNTQGNLYQYQRSVQCRHSKCARFQESPYYSNIVDLHESNKH